MKKLFKFLFEMVLYCLLFELLLLMEKQIHPNAGVICGLVLVVVRLVDKKEGEQDEHNRPVCNSTVSLSFDNKEDKS